MDNQLKMDFSTRLRNVSIIVTLVVIAYTGLIALGKQLVWRDEKDQILLLIRENEILRREENICQSSTETEREYRLCIENFERQRDIRTHQSYQ